MRLPYSLSESRPVQLGLIVLQADESIEPDMRRLLPADAELLVSRVPSGKTVSPESLKTMESVLTGAAALFPSGARFSAVGYGCTSGTAVLGAERVAGLVRSGVRTPAVTEPVSALIAACRHMEIRRLGLVSPYVGNVSDRLRAVLAGAGIEVTAFASFEEPLEENVARISGASVADAAAAMGRKPECDAVFLSCTNLRTLGVIDRVGLQVCKPVLSSNSVLAWHLLRLAGCPGGHQPFVTSVFTS